MVEDCATNGQTSPWQLFEAWVKARNPQHQGSTGGAACFSIWSSASTAHDITGDEAREWSRQLVTTKRKARTVNDVWLTAARTVFAWAGAIGHVQSFAGVRVTEPRRVEHRETDAFMPEEWGTILRAASAIGRPKTTFQGAQRWVPWLCAYSGARPGEITQLRAVDIQDRDHVKAMVLTPDAGTIKTSKARTVPIHRHLIEQGFLEFVKSRGKGPLFYDLAEQQVHLIRQTRSTPIGVGSAAAWRLGQKAWSCRQGAKAKPRLASHVQADRRQGWDTASA